MFQYAVTPIRVQALTSMYIVCIILQRAGSIFQSFCQMFYDYKNIMIYHASLLYGLIMEILKLITAIPIMAYNVIKPDGRDTSLFK